MEIRQDKDSPSNAREIRYPGPLIFVIVVLCVGLTTFLHVVRNHAAQRTVGKKSCIGAGCGSQTFCCNPGSPAASATTLTVAEPQCSRFLRLGVEPLNPSRTAKMGEIPVRLARSLCVEVQYSDHQVIGSLPPGTIIYVRSGSNGFTPVWIADSGDKIISTFADTMSVTRKE